MIESMESGDTWSMGALTFVCTCASVPEQYDVRADGVQVAYVRLRFGRLTVEMPDAGGELLLEHRWPGDDDRYMGQFTDDGRGVWLPFLAGAIAGELMKGSSNVR